ncbi:MULTISPECIES: PspA/IM30 family protein [unclassified Bacillus (in: firmicutes)]|uniref:PspA/IM30 family protein n=1 Tax=unclassified Bacillus (in: firmicutes) TaxID=185979 RepID=UPI0008E63E2A|nr:MULTISPECIES: PspA/IM30 family protein [unclassified Bacillus (in: firmicutes)]SFB08306.1 Phage shock protein A [Bacillus sp. UNCCL13]SFQ87113.1 Phage shock protein A [Bacillus sp. cl95]
MTNLFTRIKNTISADLHEVLDTKERKNPIALLNQYLRQSEQETEKVRKLLERQSTLKEEFTRELQFATDLAAKRKYQAEVASKDGESNLYEFALQEHAQYAERAERLKVSLQNTIDELQGLERKYEEMKHKLKDMHIRRMELMGKENITRANLRANTVLDENGNGDKAFAKFQDIENYLEKLEHQVNSSYYRSTIDARIAQLEKEMKKEEISSIS